MEKASFNLFLATIVLGILAFASPSFLPLPALKTVVIGVGVLVSLILYVISRIDKKSIDFPWSPITVIAALLGVSIIVSVLLSASPYSSFMGKSFGADSGIFLLVLLCTGLLTSLLVRTRDQVFMVYMSVVGSFCVAAIFHLIHFIPGTQFLSLGFFTTTTSTMVGSWYDLGIFSGAILIISLLTLDILAINKRLRIVTAVIFGLAAVFLIVTGLAYLWIALAIIALGITVTLFLNSKNVAAKGASRRPAFLAKIPAISTVVCIITIGFVWYGNAITAPVQKALNATYGEVSLPWQYTVDVAAPIVKILPLFGAGPDRFTDAYLQFKPAAINSSQFWNTAFPSGSSFILTSLVTQGLVGMLLWVLLIIFFCIQGVRVLRLTSLAGPARYTLLSSFFSAAFLWLMTILYVPSHVMLFLTFVMTGLFVAELVCNKLITTKTFDWSAGGALRVVAFIGIGLAGLALAAGAVLIVKETVSQVYLQSGISAVSNAASASDPTTAASAAKALFQKAASWNAVDTNYQALAQVDTYTVNAIVSSAASSSASNADLASTISSLIAEGIGYSRTAEILDPSNPYNYITEANVSETATGLKIPNAYENARTAYAKALQVNPLNPSIYLALAKLDYFEGSTTVAVTDINNALSLKSDYTDAIFEAGLISYDQKDYQTAEAAFIQTLKYDGTYANAAYFLSLTLVRLGDVKDAITELTGLIQQYPDNQQLSALMANLKAGKSPFSDTAAAVPSSVSLVNASSTSAAKKH